jgi:hypothetical protein
MKNPKAKRKTVDEFTLSGPLANALSRLDEPLSLHAVRKLARLGLVKVSTPPRVRKARPDLVK